MRLEVLKLGTLAEDWDRVVAWHAANAPPGTLLLPPGATDGAIAAAEQQLSLELPEDLRDFYRMHDGLGGSWLLHHGEFLSLSDMVRSVERYCRWGREAEPMMRALGPPSDLWG